MPILYKALVLSMVEYCSALWAPQKLGLVRDIESVQRQFTKKISGLENMSYVERLKKLRLFSLERRRDRFRIIYVWRIINGLSPNLSDLRYKIITKINLRRGLECKIPVLNRSANRTNSLQTLADGSFAVAGPKLFNCIDRDIREYSGPLSGFKNKLDRFLWTVPDVPVVIGQSQEIHCNRVDIRVQQKKSLTILPSNN